MVHADAVRCKGIEHKFPIETTTRWILGLGYPGVFVRTDGESSIVALGIRVGVKLREAGVKAMQNTSPAYDSTSAGHAESGVRTCEREGSHVGMLRTRTARCDSREITCFTSMMREICRSNNQQISSWNRWNDRLSQSLWSLKSPTSVRPLVGKGVLPGAWWERHME